ncbi:DUF7346 family protein [Natronomonas sp. EA1]|uniref:DUF7346 family protein n=1 Tax=Natronomonas sp. EA1 TaxID=3421655 RepID=UPI003EBFA2AF
MRTVEYDGETYLLRKQSGESSLIEHPKTGETQYVENDAIDGVAGESPLETAARAVPESVRKLISATHSDRALGLLLEIDAQGPVAARELIGRYDTCESDLHGMLGEFRAAGLVEEATVVGERGYDTTAAGEEAVAFLRRE